jgi:Cd2+/Zn2+-exporting ATPase/Cu+-exporting ATPase
MVIAGELLGLFDFLNGLIPFPIGLLIVLLGGWPVFRKVVRSALNRQIISHTLMTVGVIAALVILNNPN